MGKECMGPKVRRGWLDWCNKVDLEGMLKSACKYLGSRLESAG